MNDLRSPLGPDAMRPEPTGKPPTWSETEETCPNCRAFLCKVSTPVEPPPMLRTDNGAVAVYMGCPACPYASPAMVTADG